MTDGDLIDSPVLWYVKRIVHRLNYAINFVDLFKSVKKERLKQTRCVCGDIYEFQDGKQTWSQVSSHDDSRQIINRGV